MHASAACLYYSIVVMKVSATTSLRYMANMFDGGCVCFSLYKKNLQRRARLTKNSFVALVVSSISSK